MVECPLCGGTGCEHCDDGFFAVSKCCAKYVDGWLVDAINLTSYVEKGLLPDVGGLLNQSAWFIKLCTVVSNEQIEIDRDRERR